MNIAVACAFNPNFNTGMYTVDKTIEAILSDHNYKMFTLGNVDNFFDGEKSNKYVPLQDNFDEFINSDLMIYWGDFLHSFAYWKHDLIPRLINDNVVNNFSEGKELIYKTLLLENCKEAIFERVIIYGETLIPEDSSSLNNKRYLSNLERIISKSRAVFFRDAISSARFSYLRPGENMFTPDCAFLNSVINKEIHISNNSSAFGIYFGRSGKKERIKFIFFILTLSHILKIKPKWIQWFPVKKGDFKTKIVLKAQGEIKQENGEDTIKKILSCSFIVTDVYHIAVNSWALGVPCILLGISSLSDKNTTGSKKKEIMMNQMSAQNFYFNFETINLLTVRKLANDVQENLNNTSMIQTIIDCIKNNSKNTFTLLQNSINKIS